MKFIIEVPDTINHVYGGSSYSESKCLPVNEKLILKALTINDYHENYYFDAETKIKVEKCYELNFIKKFISNCLKIITKPINYEKKI